MKRPYTFNAEEFVSLVESGADAFNIPITPKQIDHLLNHTDLLLTWNKKTNLTRITNVEDIAVKHVLDSMAALPYLPKTGKVLDIGSGGGFPGLVLKIMRPELTIHLIDSVRKKVSFLQHVIRTLHLEGVAAYHVRAETFKNEPSQRGGYQAVVSRALASLVNFAELAIPFLASEGIIYAYKGNIEEQEVGELLTTNKAPSLTVSQKTVHLPHADLKRTIVMIQPS